MKIQNLFATAIVATATVATPSMAQVTSVSQLRDVQPTDWSYQALSNLISRYGCVAGYHSNAGGLSHYQKARGIDTTNRVRIK